MRTLAVLLVVVCTLAGAEAATINVPGDYPTIQQAIQAAEDRDVIRVGPGEYVETVYFGGKAVAVVSNDGPEVTTLRAADPNLAVVYFDDGEPKGAEISGFTITGGSPYGIYCESSSPTIRNNILTGITGSAVTLINTSRSMIKRNVFTGNSTGGYGPSVRLDGICEDDTIAYNLMYDNVGYGEIHSARFTHRLQILNNTIRPTTYSGVYHRGSGSMVIRNNIIIDAPYFAVRDDNRIATIENNCVFNNNGSGADFPFPLPPGDDNVYEDPLLTDPDNGNFNLLPGSPCIDAGHPDPIYIDLDGTRNDIGALPTIQSFPEPTVRDIRVLGEVLDHLVTNTPSFSWTYLSNTAGPQVAFELEIGTDSDWLAAEILTTGTVYTTDPRYDYSATPLNDGATYWVRVRATDGLSWGLWQSRYFRLNSSPSVPPPASPIDNEEVGVLELVLTVDDAIDFEDDTLTYDFEVFADADMTVLVAAEYGIAEQSGQTSSSPSDSLETDREFWWRARCFDGYEYSAWSTTANFRTEPIKVRRVPSEYATIQAAVDDSGPFDTVLVSDGYYTGAGNKDIDPDGRNLVFISENGPEVTVIDCQDEGRAFSFNSGERNAIVQGFTIRNGSVYRGGAVYIENASARLENCHFEGNRAQDGGAVYATRTLELIEIVDCKFMRNYCGSSLGAFTGNGGAVLIDFGAFDPTNSSDNIRIESCLFAENSAAVGAAIDIGAWTYADIANCTIVNNVAFRGPAMQIRYQGHARMDRCLIAFNTGESLIYGSDPANATTWSCSNIYGNEYGDWVGGLEGLGTSDGNFSLDPAFCRPESDNYSIRAYSPCLPENSPCGELVGALGTEECDFALPAVPTFSLYQEDPTHVVSHNPTLQWTYVDVPASDQVAYEIEVGIDGDWTVAENWMSGSISSTDQFGVYDGTLLQDGQDYHARVRVSNGTSWGDWTELSWHQNGLPSVPVVLGPGGSSEVHFRNVILSVAHSIDNELDSIFYDFEIYTDPLALSEINGIYDVAEQPEQVLAGPFDRLSLVTDYWWRTRAFDGLEYSAWSDMTAFRTSDQTLLRVPEFFTDVTSAVAVARNNDSVIVGPGTYYEQIVFGEYLVTLVSSGGAEVTFLEGAKRSISTISFSAESNQSSIIKGFTIQNSDDASALSIESGNPITIDSCVFSMNEAEDGAAIYCLSSGVTVSECTFYRGSARDGAGIYCIGSGMTIRDCVFDRNHASRDGGALLLRGSDITVEDCEFWYNGGGASGGVAQCRNGGNISFIRNLAYRNSAGVYGGGFLYAIGTVDLTVRNNTIVRNTSAGRGAGITLWAGRRLDVRNNIIESDLSHEGLWAENANEISVEYNTFFGPPGGGRLGDYHGVTLGTGCIFDDPAFINYLAPDLNLNSYSPCVDSGDPNAAFNDPDGSRSDMGARPWTYFSPIPDQLNLANEDMARVVNHSPLFTWAYQDSSATNQAAYEIEVGLDHEWTVAEMWVSGQVLSNDNFGTYDGLPLEDGRNYSYRVRLNNGNVWGSWVGGSFYMNSIPSIASVISPGKQDSLNYRAIRLIVANSVDADEDNLSYDFSVYDDQLQTHLVVEFSNIPEQQDQTKTEILVGLQPRREYWWRARATDGLESSDWTMTISFTTVDSMVFHVPDAISSIQGAIDLAGPSDVILVGPGLYEEHLTFGESSLRLLSTDGAATTTIRAVTDQKSLVDFSPGLGNNSTIAGFTFEGAYGAEPILIGEGNSPQISYCRFTDNYGIDAGGIMCLGDDVVVFGCEFRDNQCEGPSWSASGAIYVKAANLRVDSCIFIHNQSGDGGAGAIYAILSDGLQVVNNIGYANRVQRAGSGFLYVVASENLDVSSNTIVGNEGISLGGGISLRDVSEVDIQQNIVSFNEGGEGLWVHLGVSMNVDCNNIYRNPVGDYYGIEVGLNSISTETLFCNFLSDHEDFTLRGQSPCLPANNSCGVLMGARGAGQDCSDYLCGDANRDDVVDWLDVDFLTTCYFLGGPLPEPSGAGDPNCDGVIAINDLLFLVEYLSSDGPAPCCFQNSDATARITPMLRPTIPPKGESLPDRRDASGVINH